MKAAALVPSPLNPSWLIPKGWENILGINIGYRLGNSVLHLWRVQFNRHVRLSDPAEVQSHAHHQLLFYQRGGGQMVTNGHVHAVEKGSIFFVPATCRHSFRSDSAEAAVCLAIDFSVDEAAYASIGLGGLPSESEVAILLSLLHTETVKPFQIGAYQQGLLGQCIDDILRENEGREAGFASMIQSHLLRLIALCLRVTRRAQGFGEHFRHTAWRYSLLTERVNAILREHAFRDPEITLGECAKICGTSRNHLNRILKKQTGRTFHQLLLSRRLEKAQRLLKQGELNCTEVAFESGFKDSNYFSRVFRKSFGYPPSKGMKA